MARSSSSTKKAAKLAQKGKGQRVRFQGGTIFPLAVAMTLVLGLALIVYSRQTLPAADSSPPTIDDHWHAAYGFYICDTWYQLEGNLEERNSSGQFTNTEFLRTGIHSHDDGVIHWHPFTARAVGKNAVLGVFLETYGVELENDRLTFPPAQSHIGFADEYIEGETQCDGEDAELSVKAWGNFTDTDGGQRYIAQMDEVHLDNDGMVFAVYFTTDDAAQVMPPWAQQLPSLGAIDGGQIRPEDLLQPTSTVATDGEVDDGGDGEVEDGGDDGATSTTVADDPAPTTTAEG